MSSSSPALFLLLETSLKTRWSKNQISAFHLSTANVTSELASSSALFLAHIRFMTAVITLPAVMSAWLDSMHLLLICLEVMMRCNCWSNCLLLSSSKTIAMHVPLIHELHHLQHSCVSISSEVRDASFWQVFLSLSLILIYPNSCSRFEC